MLATGQDVRIDRQCSAGAAVAQPLGDNAHIGGGVEEECGAGMAQIIEPHLLVQAGGFEDGPEGQAAHIVDVLGIALGAGEYQVSRLPCWQLGERIEYQWAERKTAPTGGRLELITEHPAGTAFEIDGALDGEHAARLVQIAPAEGQIFRRAQTGFQRQQEERTSLCIEFGECGDEGGGLLRIEDDFRAWADRRQFEIGGRVGAELPVLHRPFEHGADVQMHAREDGGRHPAGEQFVIGLLEKGAGELLQLQGAEARLDVQAQFFLVLIERARSQGVLFGLPPDRQYFAEGGVAVLGYRAVEFELVDDLSGVGVGLGLGAVDRLVMEALFTGERIALDEDAHAPGIFASLLNGASHIRCTSVSDRGGLCRFRADVGALAQR